MMASRGTGTRRGMLGLTELSSSSSRITAPLSLLSFSISMAARWIAFVVRVAMAFCWRIDEETEWREDSRLSGPPPLLLVGKITCDVSFEIGEEEGEEISFAVDFVTKRG